LLVESASASEIRLRARQALRVIEPGSSTEPAPDFFSGQTSGAVAGNFGYLVMERNKSTAALGPVDGTS
jgi:hypothetical protein